MRTMNIKWLSILLNLALASLGFAQGVSIKAVPATPNRIIGHYRNASGATARQLREVFDQLVQNRAPKLAIRESKMAAEVLPRSASKAHAVRKLWQLVGNDFEPIYFGDDLTDEDAFRELRGRGVTVLVGAPRPTAARYCVENPKAVAGVLKTIASSLVRR